MKRERENNPRRLTTARSSRRPWWTAEAATGAGVIPMARGKTSGSTDAKGRGGAACTSNWSEGERWQRNRRRIGARRRWREEEKEEHGCRCLAFIDEGDVTTLKASSRSRPRDGRAYRREEAPRRDRRQTASGEEETEEAAAGVYCSYLTELLPPSFSLNLAQKHDDLLYPKLFFSESSSSLI